MTTDVQSLDRAFQILASIGRAGTCSLSELAAARAMPFSTVHRIVGSLIDNGYVIRHGRGNYALGPAFLDFAGRVSLADMLAGIGRPILAALARECRACTHLGILDADMVTYLVKQGFGRERVLSVEGMQLEAYCSAIGKMLLAHLPEDECARYLATDGFVRLTPRTITDPALLAAELVEIRARGWAVDDEEIMAGLRCVAVPVVDPAGKAVAALSVSATAKRMPPDRIAEILPHAEAAARRVADHLYPSR